MIYNFKENKTGADLQLFCGEDQISRNVNSRENSPKYFTIAWNRGETRQVILDDTAYEFPANSMLTLLFNQSYQFDDAADIVAWRFNREFYCIVDHDKEVSCVGFLFGITEHLFIHLGEEGRDKMRVMTEIFTHELQTQDHVQNELLLVLLKRLIIFITRLARNEYIPTTTLSDDRFDIVRKFSLLVERDFHKEHSVSYYAGCLNKSPKTLANLFAIYNQKTPQQMIHERIIIEAKRLLTHTDKPVKQITYDLGFEEAPHFSSFFKKQAGIAPLDYRNSVAKT